MAQKCFIISSRQNFPIFLYLFFVGLDNDSAYSGRVISVKLGECTRRIGIDGSSDAIKEAIKSSLGLRTKRAFWLEDENEIVRTLHRDMPLGAYTLHLDEGNSKEELRLFFAKFSFLFFINLNLFVFCSRIDHKTLSI